MTEEVLPNFTQKERKNVSFLKKSPPAASKQSLHFYTLYYSWLDYLPNLENLMDIAL